MITSMQPTARSYIIKPEENPLFISSSGERVIRYPNAIVVLLPERRSVLSTSYVNGGYREDLTAVYNNQPIHRAEDPHTLEGGSIPAYLALTGERLGLDPATSAGLITAAEMKHASVVSRSFRGVEVTAIITAGIEVNGGRAGDPASYYQENGLFQKLGTINTILLIGADLPEHAMNRAVITAVEAKAAALQELMASSRYSSGIATGSGTDQIAIIADRNSPYKLTDTGKHSKLGELIGVSVLEATKEALGRQSHLTPVSQRDVMVRLERFSITEEQVWTASCRFSGENRKGDLIRSLREMATDPAVVAGITAVIHLHDEISYGLIPEVAGGRAAIQLLLSVPGVIALSPDDELQHLLTEENPVLENLVLAVGWMAKRRFREE